MERAAALEEVRKRMMAKKGGRARDPMQFSAPSVKADETLKFKFYVLPGLQAGDVCASGKASKTMDLWYVTVGTHWINNRPYECPRVHDGVECPFCQLGFDLLQDTDDDNLRKNIIKTYFPRTTYVTNIYFPAYESTPAELRGKVMWYAAPKTVYDIMENTIMRNESQDGDDPQAFGLFYNPDDAYVFQLEINHQGGYNEYKSSKFLVPTKGPMIKSKTTGELDAATMTKVLAMRHDLFTKFAARDAEALAKCAQEIMQGETDKPTSVATTSSTKTVKPAEVVEDEDKLLDDPIKPNVAKTTKPAAKVVTPEKKPAPIVEEQDDELNKLLNDIRKGN